MTDKKAKQKLPKHAQDYVDKCNDLMLCLTELYDKVDDKEVDLIERLGKACLMIEETSPVPINRDLKGHYSYIVSQVKDIFEANQDGWFPELYKERIEVLRKASPDSTAKLETIIKENNEFIEANLRMQQNAPAISPTDLPPIEATKKR